VIVFDAGVLIAHLDPDDVFHSAATGFMEECEDFDFGASALTVAECLVHAVAAGRSTTVLGAFERLTLVQFDVNVGDAYGVAEVRAATKLRMPDAVVLFTAERHGAELATTDHVLARAAAARGVTATLLEAA
jgi:predicted nucleic acid-binding protein